MPWCELTKYFLGPAAGKSSGSAELALSVCANSAVKARYTLYYHLEKIAGGNLAKFYNLANGVLFCFLAGAGVPRLWCGGLEAVGGD